MLLYISIFMRLSFKMACLVKHISGKMPYDSPYTSQAQKVWQSHSLYGNHRLQPCGGQ